MKIKPIQLSLWAMLAVLLLASCTRIPKYVKVIPADATVVMRIDVEQLAEKSGFGDDSKTKQKLTEALKEADLSREAREKAEAILDDPAKAGLDLRSPVFVFAGEKDNNSYEGVVGEILDKDDFTQLLNAFAKESDIAQVKESGNVSYFVQDRTMIVFDKSYFYIGKRPYGQEAIDFVNEVAKKFESDGKNSMLESEHIKKICASKGIAQLFINGKAIAELKDFKRAEGMLPNGLKYEDISYLFDLSAEKGKASLAMEVLPSSDAWKKQIAESDKLVGKYSDDLLKYVSKDGFAMFVNMDIPGLLKMLKESALWKEIDPAQQKEFEEILTSIDGSLAFGISDFYMEHGIPKLAAYFTTNSDKVVKMLAQNQDDGEMKQTAGGYTLPLGYDTDLVQNFGYKDKVSYYLMDKTPAPFKEAANHFASGDLKGKGLYLYFNFDFLKKISDKLPASEGKAAIDTAVKIFDKAELYYEGDGRMMLEVKTKDKEHTPIESIIEFAFNYLDYQVVEETEQ